MHGSYWPYVFQVSVARTVLASTLFLLRDGCEDNMQSHETNGLAVPAPSLIVRGRSRIWVTWHRG